MNAVLLYPPLTEETLKALFTKPYRAPGPTADQWRAVYDNAVHFQDPTQERSGIDAYIAAQDDLMGRCDDIFLEPGAVALSGETAFVEWKMGLKIKGIEFIYPGTTRLRIAANGMIVEHRDYFDFVGPTFEPVPVVGGFVRWLYRRFVS
ncbi:MAG: nuclear transport factor 2 family protein [Cyanobacteria bacterium]|nr:nuclear transport factor 2 family protein [Cyanobacteriota bacterium]